MKILVTGSAGFIGKNLISRLPETDEIMAFDRENTLGELAEMAARADIVFHLAGVNRPTDPLEFETGNAGLTEKLAGMLEGRKIPVVMTGSIQAGLDNAYGKSKKAAEDALFAYSARTGAPVFIYRLPNVFGKWCRPDYNSVVATFCHNIAHGKPVRIDDEQREVTLCYIDDVADEFIRVLGGKAAPVSGEFCSIEPQYKITLGELAESIRGFERSRRDLTHRYDRTDALQAKLYAAYSSYLPELSVQADMKTDARGFFAELIKSPHFGQVSVSGTKPGVTRGNHWHSSKAEKFIVIQGTALIRVRRIDETETKEYVVSGDKIEIVDIPAGCVHSLENIGSTDVLTLFWADLFDPENPDTYPLQV